MTFRFVAGIDGTDFTDLVYDLDASGRLYSSSRQPAHHVGDDDQRGTCAGLAVGKPGSRVAVVLHFTAMPSHRSSDRVWHRSRRHFRVLGLGGRTLFHGQRDRPFHDGRRGRRDLIDPALVHLD
jgi:hypothetical protein